MGAKHPCFSDVFEGFHTVQGHSPDIHSQVNSYARHSIAQPPQRPPELFFRVRHYHQMFVARAQAELLHPLAGRDLFGDFGVGAFDEQRRAFVRASPRAALGRDDEAFDRFGQFLYIAGLQELVECGNLAAGFDGFDRLLLIEMPRVVGFFFRPGFEQHRFVERERAAADGDAQAGQDGQTRAGFDLLRGISVGQSQAVRAEGVEPEVHQPVVAAEEVQVVRAPQCAEVAARLRWVNVGYVNHAKRRCVLEQQAHRVAPLHHQPLGLAPVAAEVAVLLVFDVEVDRIARDFKIEGRRQQVAEEVINLHPLTRRALLQSFSQYCAPRFDGGEVAPAAVAFAFDDLNAAELFFFNHTATAVIYTLSLHYALPL